ncbi:SOS peptidase SRAP [Pontimonas salivibrio]|uniref:Abasic site processing protein n=1 Tax=Pontimonas salivibrio TaxID=1159327 RepID=A0A2L2BQ79_9MICO|nr:SOS response-associated peptidase [Pontimonas salivibrio]AVG23809.1 SOS peptidase SRAP [Pontimonas salivibrio]
MCGRYALGVSQEQLSDYFHVGASRLTRWSPSWNIAPTATIPIIIDRVVDTDRVERIVGPARWSLTPTWAETLETPYPTFNARSETVSTKPTFRQALAHSRALIPASGYFEWHTDGKTKTPHYIYPANESLFAFAGLYSLWGTTGQQVVTATILTREAPHNLDGIHPRSPVPLPTEQWSRWLDPHSTADAQLVEDMVSCSQEILEHASHHPVNPLRGDSPQLIQPKP